MNCIHCNTKLKCDDTTSTGDVTYRRYKCPNCKALTYTEEYPMYDADAKGMIYEVKRVKRMEKAFERI